MLTIKRYSNRKFYDPEEKGYITLEDIADRIREGREVQVIDHASGEDITAVVLTQIILEQEKKQTGFIPRSVLTGLVQAGGLTIGRMRNALANPLELLKQIDAEIEHRIEVLINRGELAEDEARRWRDKLLAGDVAPQGMREIDEELFQQMLDERGVPTSNDIQALTGQLEELLRKIDALETESSEQA
jgi:polyhydroxyalkanoate synthesis repressor PhaR